MKNMKIRKVQVQDLSLYLWYIKIKVMGEVFVLKLAKLLRVTNNKTWLNKVCLIKYFQQVL